MSGNIRWPHNGNSYRHGIVCRHCIVKKYDAASSVSTVHVGTLVEILNVREENVVFRIFNYEVDDNDDLFLCKIGDVLFVPENLWGPLLTVDERERLSIVQDTELAEALGNVTVGNAVRVLGPDFENACIGTVKFKNAIAKLGMGVYFGLTITCPIKDLQFIKENCSLLEPGTKGFPRGCDIVVPVNKIRPLKEKDFPVKEECNSKSVVKSYCTSSLLKSKPISQLKEKLNGRASHHEEGSSVGDLNSEKKKPSLLPLSVGEQVVHIDDTKIERGTVRWVGLIKKLPKVGVEFDNPIGSGTGTVDGVELFRARPMHAAFMPPESLIKLSDFDMNNSKDYGNQQKTTVTANNNNNYNSRSNGQCCSWRQNLDDRGKMVKINSFQNSKSFASSHCGDGYHLKNCNGDCTVRNLECVGSCNTECKICISQMQFPSRSFDSVRSSANEKKLCNNRQSRSMDNDLAQNRELVVNLQNSFDSMQKPPGKDLDDFFGRSWTDSCDFRDSAYDSEFHPGTSDLNSAIYSDTCDYAHSIKKRNILNNEQCGSNGSGRPNCWNDGFYDSPSSAHKSLAVHRGSLTGDRARVNVPEPDLRERYRKDFYRGRRHTLSPAHYNKTCFPEFAYAPQEAEVWETNSENSSSDEGVDYYDTPKPFAESVQQKLGRGSVVELLYKGQPYYGVIRWIGTIPEEGDGNRSSIIAGIEMEEERSGFTDGTFRNKRYFQCNPRKALFVPLSECRKDSRFVEEKRGNCVKINSFGQVDCPVVEGTIPPITFSGDLEAICGKNRGIQGHHNSCYLDATLFAMFAFTSVFDSLLYRPPTVTDIPQYAEVQRVLKEEIVNPLRKNLYVRADRVMKLRTLLENLSSVSGLTCDEKDPEEFLNSLLAQILRAEPFLKLSSGQETFHYQLFVEKDERLVFPSVQQLFEQSFVTSDIKLKQIPSCLIIQMPRFGKSFKMYSRIFPPQLLDVTDIIENSPRQCTVCGKLAEYECKDCFGQNGIGSGLESISYCKTCLEKAHTHHCRVRHNYRSITVPFEFFDLQEHCTIPRINMELYAVVCIETSHYVSFVKCGTGSDAPWCFFDSMADRKGEQNGYNIPEMVACPELPFWLSEEGMKTLNEMKDERQLPEHAKRLLCDAYMCMYQSPDIMMYR